MTKLESVPHPGLRARDIRIRRRLTLDQLAETTQLSKGYLSRFERGEKTLSVAALIRLSTALQVSVGTILGEEIDSEEIRLVRADDRPSLTASREDGTHEFHALSGHYEGQCHSTFIVDVPINSPHVSEAFHSGRELLFILDGSILISLGKETHCLKKGDYLEFPGNIPHTIISPDSVSRILLVVVDTSGKSNLTPSI